MPSVKISAGMIPTFAFPGESAPGQFGPSMVTPRGPDVVVDAEHLVRGQALGDADRPCRCPRRPPRRSRRRRSAPARRPSPCSRRSRSTASATVSKTGMPSTSWPPLPGVTPATTCVPYALLRVRVERALAAGQALDDETRVSVDDDRHQRLRPLSAIRSSRTQPSSMRSREQLADAAPRPRPCSRLARATARARSACRSARPPSTLEPGVLEDPAPLGLGVVAHVRRVAQPLGLLDLVAHEQVVDDEHELAADAGHLADGRLRVVEVMGGDPADDDVEARRPRRADARRAQITSGCMPGAGSRETTSSPASRSRRATWPPPVATSSAVCAPAAHSTSEVEIGPLTVRLALPVELRAAVAPDVAHCASSTARRAASSIVGSTWRFGGAASVRSRRPSSAFVPSSRTTIGCSIVIRSSAGQDPARDLVAARDAAEDVEEDRAHLGVGGDHLERVDDALRRRRRRRGRRSSPAGRRRARSRPAWT